MNHIKRNSRRWYHNNIKLLLWLVLIIAIPITGGLLAKAINSDYMLYKQESACVQKLIAKGVHRARIQTNNGTCSIN